MFPHQRPPDAPPIDPHYGDFTRYGKTIIRAPDPTPFDLTPEQEALVLTWKKEPDLFWHFVAENKRDWEQKQAKDEAKEQPKTK